MLKTQDTSFLSCPLLLLLLRITLFCFNSLLTCSSLSVLSPVLIFTLNFAPLTGTIWRLP